MSAEANRHCNLAIAKAAAWLQATPRKAIEGNVVHSLRERFGLSTRQAVAACSLAEQIRRDEK
jgi:hypothetical protein